MPEFLSSNEELNQYCLKEFTSNLKYNHRIDGFSGEIDIETTKQNELIVFGGSGGPMGLPFQTKKSTVYITHLLEGDDFAVVLLVKNSQRNSIDFTTNSLRINNDFRKLRDGIIDSLEYRSVENKTAFDELHDLGKPIYTFVYSPPNLLDRLPNTWLAPIAAFVLVIIIILIYRTYYKKDLD